MKDGTYLVKRDGTIVNYGERWNYGFFVADGRNGVQLKNGENAAHWIADATFTDYLVGVWTDANTRIVYVDPVDHVSDYDSAVKLAKDRGELAIWDAFKEECIYL